MFSRGALGGADINGFSVNGGNFVQEAAGSNTGAATDTLRLTRRLVARTADIVAVSATARLVVRGIRLKDTVSTTASAKAIRRLVAMPLDVALASDALEATRRLVAKANDEGAAPGALAFSVRYSVQTKINRVMRVRELSSMRAPAPSRSMTVAPRERPMVVPVAAGDMP